MHRGLSLDHYTYLSIPPEVYVPLRTPLMAGRELLRNLLGNQLNHWRNPLGSRRLCDISVTSACEEVVVLMEVIDGGGRGLGIAEGAHCFAWWTLGSMSHEMLRKLGVSLN